MSETVALWLGAPVVSCRFTLMLYVPALALFGILIVAARVAVPLAEIVSGFPGVSEHIAPESELASQLALIFPE